MDLRDSKSRLILIVVALGIALVVVVASCGGGSGSDEGDDGGAVAEATDDDGGGGEAEGTEDGADADAAESSEEAGSPLAEVSGEADITLTVTDAQREEGGFVTVEGTLRNDGGDGWRANNWRGSEAELADNGFSMAGATLTAKAEGKKYLILRDTSGRCLCTRFDLQIDPGETVTWFAQFPEPDPATTEVDFQVGEMPPATFEIS